MSVTVLGSGDSAVNKIDEQPAVIEQEGGSRRGGGRLEEEGEAQLSRTM